jgi:6-phosphogluconolactonase
MTSPRSIHVFPDAEAASRAAADAVARAAHAALADRSVFRLGLSGGTAPRRLYQMLAESPEAIDWRRTRVLFADERGVPPDHRDSNYGMVRDLLLRRVPIPESQVHRMQGEAEDLEAAARAYEPSVAEPIDLLILGVGEDGHTASLFPDAPSLREHTRSVIAVTAPKPPARRITLAPGVIDRARGALVLAFGARPRPGPSRLRSRVPRARCRRDDCGGGSGIWTGPPRPG